MSASAPVPARIAVAVTAAAFLAGSLLLTLCRVVTPGAWLLVVLTAFVPFALPGYLVTAALLAGLRRMVTGEWRRWTSAALAVSLVGALVHAALLLPSYVGSHPDGPPDLTVLTLNLRLGQADPAQVVGLARRSDADVVVLEEVTREAEHGLADAGLLRLLPHTAGRSGRVAEGTMVFSRFPFTGARQLFVYNGGWQVQVEARRPFTLIAVHAAQPLHALPLWRSDQAHVRAAAGAVDGPLVVAGDFNATLDHAPLRRLAHDGLRDAARQANSGWQPTWPGDRRAYHGLPFGLGVLALDHVFLRGGLGAVSTDTETVTGTDHRALVARLAWR